MAAIITRTPRNMTVVERPLSLFDEMARDLWYSWPFARTYRTGLTPRIDMYEYEDELVIRAELPGVHKDNLDVSIDGDMLIIKGEKKEKEEVSENANYYFCERSMGSFTRSISLPFPVDFDKVSSTFENGVLEIRLPKTAEVKAKHIEVKVK